MRIDSPRQLRAAVLVYVLAYLLACGLVLGLALTLPLAGTWVG